MPFLPRHCVQGGGGVRWDSQHYIGILTVISGNASGVGWYLVGACRRIPSIYCPKSGGELRQLGPPLSKKVTHWAQRRALLLHFESHRGRTETPPRPYLDDGSAAADGEVADALTANAPSIAPNLYRPGTRIRPTRAQPRVGYRYRVCQRAAQLADAPLSAGSAGGVRGKTRRAPIGANHGEVTCWESSRATTASTSEGQREEAHGTTWATRLALAGMLMASQAAQPMGTHHPTAGTGGRLQANHRPPFKSGLGRVGSCFAS